MTPTAQLMPTALRRTVACSIRKATEPGNILHRLLDGKPKMLISIWSGDAGTSQEEYSFSPTRGDGSTLLVPGDSPLYHLREEPAPEHQNIQHGIPIWLLAAKNALSLDDPSQVQVRGYGLVHPLFNSASLDYYDMTGAFQFRQYLFDPRITQQQADGIDEAEHFRRLQDMSAWIDSASATAPTWNPPCAQAPSEPQPPNPPLWKDNGVPLWKRMLDGLI